MQTAASTFATLKCSVYLRYCPHADIKLCDITEVHILVAQATKVMVEAWKCV